MKNKIYTALLLFAIVFQSCENTEEVETPNFTVSYEMDAKAGEPIEFSIGNAPQFLSFFSGEFGKEYKNRNRTKATGDFTVSFETSRHYQDGSSRSDGAWRFMYSTDYTGSGIAADVEAATWVNISDRVTFATARTYNKTFSGIADITDLSTDKPVYMAIRILAEGEKTAGNRQGIFDFFSFDLTLALDETNTLQIADMDSPGFFPVNVAGENSNASFDHWVARANSYRMHGGNAEYTNDDWLITQPLNLSGAVSPDRGEPLKTYSEKLESFTHTYTSPGTYTVTFVGRNETIYGAEETVKEFTIVVE